MKRIDKQFKQNKNNKAFIDHLNDVADDDEFDNSSNSDSPSKKSKQAQAKSDAEALDIFEGPAALLYKRSLMVEVESMLNTLENKIVTQSRNEYKHEVEESVRHMRIEIQNYLYRMSDGVLSAPSGGFGVRGEKEASGLDEDRNASGSGDGKQFFMPMSNHGKVQLSQQVDAMHYRLEDVCNAMAVIKEETENNNSSLLHDLQNLDSRLDEMGLTNNSKLTSVQTRSSHIEEMVHSLEMSFHKALSENKEEVLNRLRDATLGGNDDRANIDRRLAVVENIMSTLEEKNRVSSDMIDAYFASSKDIRKFETNGVKLDGVQVELKHTREELRGLSATMTRFTSQTPRMDDVLELRDRVSNVEPLTALVSSLQTALAESKESSSLLKQLIKANEDRCARAADNINSINTQINTVIIPNSSKQEHTLSTLEDTLKRNAQEIKKLEESVATEHCKNLEKWDANRVHLEEKFNKVDESFKSSLNALHKYVIVITLMLNMK